MALRLDSAGLRRAWASTQLLSTAPYARTAADVVDRLVGVQAQDLTAAALAIRARTRGLTATDVESAARRDRSLVLTWSLRGTRHFHAAGDVRWIVGLLGRSFARGTPARNQQLGIDGARGDEAVRVLRRALEADGPLTRPEVRRRLAACGVDPDGQAPVHVLHRAALEGLICVLPGPGEEAYVLLDDWVPRARPVPPDQAVAELARRYLAGYGPATPRDFAAWSGLGLTVARSAWRALAGDLIEVEEPRGRSWALARRRSGQSTPSPVRLLGGFDSLLLGYADRSPVLGGEHARSVNSGGGMVKPVVVADGQAVGTWRHRGGRAGVAVELRPFGALDADMEDAIDREVADVRRFLAPIAVSGGATG